MPVCIDCHLFDGGDFTTGIVGSEACTLQIIFDGGNFTTGVTNDQFHTNTCVIDGNKFLGVKGYSSLDHATIVGAKTVEKKFVSVYTREVSSDPRQPVTLEKDGFIIRKRIDPKQPGEFIVMRPPGPEFHGTVFVAAVGTDGLAWRPVAIGRTVRDLTNRNPLNESRY